MQKITYTVEKYTGEIYWAASEFFGELSGKKFSLDEMEATKIESRTDLTNIGKILLSAVAGAVIQHLIDQKIDIKSIFEQGIIEIG